MPYVNSDFILSKDANGIPVQTFVITEGQFSLAANGVYTNSTTDKILMLRLVATTDTYFKTKEGDGTNITVSATGVNVGSYLPADDKEFITLFPGFSLKIDSAGALNCTPVGKVV